MLCGLAMGLIFPAKVKVESRRIRQCICHCATKTGNVIVFLGRYTQGTMEQPTYLSVLNCVLVTVARLLLTCFLTMAAEVISDGNTRKGEL